MTDDEARIRTLIERWAQAVHAGDLDSMLADHASDIVMFDVPPQHDGVRGSTRIARRGRRSSTGLRQGAVFEIVDLEVIAGDDVAFAHALLRCGTPTAVEARYPDHLGRCRLRDERPPVRRVPARSEVPGEHRWG